MWILVEVRVCWIFVLVALNFLKSPLFLQRFYRAIPVFFPPVLKRSVEALDFLVSSRLSLYAFTSIYDNLLLDSAQQLQSVRGRSPSFDRFEEHKSSRICRTVSV